jgi:hypothetical protein
MLRKLKKSCEQEIMGSFGAMPLMQVAVPVGVRR